MFVGFRVCVQIWFGACGVCIDINECRFDQSGKGMMKMDRQGFYVYVALTSLF